MISPNSQTSIKDSELYLQVILLIFISCGIREARIRNGWHSWLLTRDFQKKKINTCFSFTHYLYLHMMHVTQPSEIFKAWQTYKQGGRKVTQAGRKKSQQDQINNRDPRDQMTPVGRLGREWTLKTILFSMNYWQLSAIIKKNPAHNKSQ